jgi:hypothetical protein
MNIDARLLKLVRLSREHAATADRAEKRSRSWFSSVSARDAANAEWYEATRKRRLVNRALSRYAECGAFPPAESEVWQ